MDANVIQNKSNALITCIANEKNASDTVISLQQQLADAQSKLDEATKALTAAQQDLQNVIAQQGGTTNAVQS